MRLFAWTLAALLAVCVGVPGQASASVTVKDKTVHYRISGDTGVALLEAMDRRGPRMASGPAPSRRPAIPPPGPSSGA